MGTVRLPTRCASRPAESPIGAGSRVGEVAKQAKRRGGGAIADKNEAAGDAAQSRSDKRLCECRVCTDRTARATLNDPIKVV